MKKAISVLIFTLMILAVLPLASMDAEAASIVDSGKCGDNLTWTLDSDGVLTISGTGKMYDWEPNLVVGYDTPWNNKSVKKAIIKNGVTSIGTGAFDEERLLTSISIPNSVTSIGDNAFFGCVLTNINLPSSITSIGYRAFAGCCSLTTINLPSSITSIGSEAFGGCYSLTTINLPNSITSIGFGAFSDCYGLTNITIPSSVVSIGNDAFGACHSLTSITVSQDNKYYSSCNGILFNKSADKLICYPAGKSAKTYTIPSSVTSIGDYAFDYNLSLTSITIPSGVVSIGGFAFTKCESLTSITIPSSVTSIGPHAIPSYFCFKDIYYTGTQKQWNNISIREGNNDLTSVTIHYITPLKITTQPKTAYAGLGESVKLTVAASGDGLTYTWYFKNPTSSSYTKSGITSSAYSVIMQNAIAGRKVYCVVTDKYGNTVKSNTVTIYPAAAITAQPKTSYTKLNSTAKATVTASGEGITYTWYFKNPGSSSYTKSGITSSTYSTTMQKSISGRQVYCIVTDKGGNSVKSDTVTLYLAATITKQPTNATVAIGGKATASVIAAGDAVTYTWYFKNPGSSSFTKSGVTSSTYSMTMQQSLSGRQVYCVVTDKYGKTAKSNTVTLSAAASLKITTQPKAAYAKLNSTAKVTVAASGSGLTYTWYFKNPGSSSYTKSGITSSTYSMTMQQSLSGRLVYCIVSDKYGNQVRSNTVRIYLQATVTKQPTDASAAVGEKAKVSVTAAGDGLTYTWYFKNPGSSSFTKSGITSSTYSVTMQQSLSGRQVYCVVTDKYGNTVKSNTVTITAQ
ncbi:MAG: leucine-rich repeat protein [Clostridia bacterium]|nr:leucine-rich repeat protein [Clostridia bacterium]